jgi:ribonuclease P protein component
MTLVCLKRAEGGLRVAFAAGKAVGSAVARNRQRRRLREAFRSLWAGIAHHTADVVFVAQPSADAANFAALKAEMAKLLQRAGVAPVGEWRRRTASG